MRARWSCSGLIVLLALLGCQETPADKKRDWPLNREPVPPFVLPESVELREDVRFASPGGHDLAVDLFLPKAKGESRPAVIWIFGGGWSSGTKLMYWRHAARMAERGLVGACIQYRLAGVAKFPAAVDDCKTAVRWLRTNAATYRVDPERIGVVGASSGGHLATFLGVTPDLPFVAQGDEYPGVSVRVQAVVAMCPVWDIVGMADPQLKPWVAKIATRFLGATFEEDPELWAKATPTTYLDGAGELPPFLIMHGMADKLPYEWSRRLQEALLAAGASVELFTVEGGTHHFFYDPPTYAPSLKKLERFLVGALLKEKEGAALAPAGAAGDK